MKPSVKFLALLAMLAKQSGEVLDDFRGEFYLGNLEPHGLERVNVALEKLLRTSRRFPTIGEIETAMGIIDTTPTARDFAVLLVDRVCAALTQYGEILAPTTMRGAEAALGVDAWTLVQRNGGWNECLERYGENQATFRAQLRDSAAAYLATGQIQAQALPALPDRHEANRIGRELLEAPTQPAQLESEDDEVRRRSLEGKRILGAALSVLGPSSRELH